MTGDDASLTAHPIADQGAVKGWAVAGLDYATFKLFLLSILWRAGVATRGEFATCELGDHEPELRRMLRERDAGAIGDYPCILFATKQPWAAISFRPLRRDFDEHHGYRFLLTRLMPWFILARGCQEKIALHAALKPDGSWLVGLIDLGELDEFREGVRLLNLTPA